MTRRLRRQDISALAIAGFATLLTSAFAVRDDPQPDPTERHDPALDGLIDVQTAMSIGVSFLDEPHLDMRLSFEPEHERLVWRVSGESESVVLDAATGEALSFEYE